jgi:uncharacterized membrane protein YuzA (DUF378 family)
MLNKMCGVHKVAWVLVLVGALNWGLVGLFQWNLVAALVGGWPMLERLVYILVGAASVLMLLMPSCKPCKECLVQK